MKLLEEKTHNCKICYKPIEVATFHSLFERDVTICHECLLKFGPVFEVFYVDKVKGIFLYYYNEKVQEMLYQFKGCFDYELKSVFLEYYKHILNMLFNGCIMIPAPSSKNSDEERGFNHVEEMFGCLKLKMEKCIHKTKDVKQADLTTKEREKISKNLVIDDIDLSNKKVLLVDDVYTTGSTMKSMINLVKSKGAKIIKVLVMSKTIDLEKRE